MDDETVRRILAKHYRPTPGQGPSWLLPIGKSPNKLSSMDLFRLESVFLRSFWVMVVMDQFTRQLVGFSVHQGALNGSAICFMFNKIVYRKTWPKYLSTDHDPLFEYCLWSHPFVERLIGSCRREFTDHILFWSESDLLAKLSVFQEYFNSYRVHYSHAGKTPAEMDGKRHLAALDVKNFKWKSVCGGMYHTPIAA